MQHLPALGMDFAHHRQVLEATTIVPFETRPPSAATHKSVALGSTTAVELSCFLALRRSLKQHSFSAATIDRILCSRRTSTLQVYYKKWDALKLSVLVGVWIL